ncbi:MAG: hypothetical protein ACYC7D_10380 [Nitrososphaerales archaeon]
MTVETIVELSFSESFLKLWKENMGTLKSIEQYIRVDLEMGLEAKGLELAKDATVTGSVWTRPSWDSAIPATVEEDDSDDLR